MRALRSCNSWLLQEELLYYPKHLWVSALALYYACTKVQRAIVVLLTLASAFKVYVKFFFMLWARLSDEISYMGIGLVQVWHQSFSCDGQGAIRQAILYSDR